MSFVKKITIYSHIAQIDSLAFSECDNLESITMPDVYKGIYFKGIPKSCQLIYKKDMLSDDKEAWSNEIYKDIDKLDYVYENKGISIKGINCKNITCIKISPYIDGIPVRCIRFKAFKDCELLREMVIPNTVFEIYNPIFNNCGNLKLISMPKRFEHVKFTDIPDACEIIYT